MSPTGDHSASPFAPRVRGWLIIASVVMAAHAWMATLFFSLDDFDFIPDAAAGLHTDSYLMGGQAPGTTNPDELGFAFVIRPVLSLALRADMALFGTSPRAMHWVSVLWHIITCICLFEVIRALASRTAGGGFALGSALIFALLPSKMGAIAWISTRGDLMVGTFGLLALLSLIRFRGNRSRLALIACVAFTLLAMGSKESGIVVPALLVVCDIAFLRTSRRSASLMAVLQFMLIIVYLGFRYWRLGDNMAYYAGESRVLTVDILQRVMESILPTLNCLIGGSFLVEMQEGPWFTVAVVATVFATLLGLRRQTGRGRLAFVATCVLLLLAMAPALRFLKESSAVNLSRLFYLPSLPLSILIAWPLASWKRFHTTEKRLFATALVVLLCVWGRSLIVEGQLLVRTARESLAITKAIETAASRNEPNTLIVVEGVPASIDSSPAIGLFLSKAFQPPFRQTSLPVKSVLSLSGYLKRAEYLLHEGPVLTLRWLSADQKLEQVGELLSAPESPPEPIVTHSTAGIIERDISTRGIHHIVANLDGVGVGHDLHLKLEFNSGDTREIVLAATSGMASLPRRIFYTRMNDWFVTGGRLQRLSYRMAEGGPSVRSFAFSLDMPTIAWHGPKRGSSSSLDGEGPRFRFNAPDSCRLFALELREQGTWRFYFRRDQCRDLGNGTLEWSFDSGGTPIRGNPVVSWKTIVPFLRQHLTKRGLGRLNMWCQLEGYESNSEHPVTQSSQIHILFTP